jgi:WXG100 family type VII secretion target
MAKQIRINPDELDAVAEQVRKSRAQSADLINNLKKSILGLQNQWEGTTQTRFYSTFTAAQKEMDSYLRLLEDVATDMKNIATKFRQTDESR